MPIRKINVKKDIRLNLYSFAAFKVLEQIFNASSTDSFMSTVRNSESMSDKSLWQMNNYVSLHASMLLGNIQVNMAPNNEVYLTYDESKNFFADIEFCKSLIRDYIKDFYKLSYVRCTLSKSTFTFPDIQDIKRNISKFEEYWSKCIEDVQYDVQFYLTDTVMLSEIRMVFELVFKDDKLATGTPRFERIASNVIGKECDPMLAEAKVAARAEFVSKTHAASEAIMQAERTYETEIKLLKEKLQQIKERKINAAHKELNDYKDALWKVFNEADMRYVLHGEKYIGPHVDEIMFNKTYGEICCAK